MFPNCQGCLPWGPPGVSGHNRHRKWDLLTQIVASTRGYGVKKHQTSIVKSESTVFHAIICDLKVVCERAPIHTWEEIMHGLMAASNQETLDWLLRWIRVPNALLSQDPASGISSQRESHFRMGKMAKHDAFHFRRETKRVVLSPVLPEHPVYLVVQQRSVNTNSLML